MLEPASKLDARTVLQAHHKQLPPSCAFLDPVVLKHHATIFRCPRLIRGLDDHRPQVHPAILVLPEQPHERTMVHAV